MAQQIKKKFIGADQIDGSKIKLLEGEALRGINSLGQEVELIKLSSENKLLAQGEELALKTQVDTALSDAKDYTDQKVADLVDSAPEILDTLKELSDALGGDANFATTVAGQIGAVDDKVDQEILDRIAGDSSTLDSAKAYADAKFAEIPPVDLSNYYNKTEVDEKDLVLSNRITALEVYDQETVHVDNVNGVDEVGRGSMLRPFKTINYAYSQVESLGNQSNTSYNANVGRFVTEKLVIHLAPGRYTENVVLGFKRARVKLVGDGATIIGDVKMSVKLADFPAASLESLKSSFPAPYTGASAFMNFELAGKSGGGLESDPTANVLVVTGQAALAFEEPTVPGSGVVFPNWDGSFGQFYSYLRSVSVGNFVVTTSHSAATPTLPAGVIEIDSCNIASTASTYRMHTGIVPYAYLTDFANWNVASKGTTNKAPTGTWTLKAHNSTFGNVIGPRLTIGEMDGCRIYDIDRSMRGTVDNGGVSGSTSTSYVGFVNNQFRIYGGSGDLASAYKIGQASGSTRYKIDSVSYTTLAFSRNSSGVLTARTLDVGAGVSYDFLDDARSIFVNDPATNYTRSANTVDAALEGIDTALGLKADQTTTSSLQSQINTEKGRVDAILSASTADKDSFAEIVALINSVDVENDNAFAGYVLSNDAAVSALDGRVDTLESEMDSAQSDILSLDGRLDTLEPKVSTLESEMDTAQSDILSLDSRLDAMEAFGYDQILYVSKNGVDTNSGKQHSPFLTITAAQNAITDASPTKRYLVKVQPGNYSEAIALKANVFIVGEGSKEAVRVTGAISMHSSFSGSSDHRSGFSNITLLSAADFNWQTVTSAAGKLYMNEVVFGSTLNMYGHNNAIAQAQFNACIIFGNVTVSGINVGVFTDNVCYGNVTLNQHPNGGMATILVATGGYCSGTVRQTTTVNDFNRRCATFLRSFASENLIIDGPSSYADVDLTSQGKSSTQKLNGGQLIALNPRISHDIETQMIKPLASNSHNLGDWGKQWMWNFGYVHASSGTDLFLISYPESYAPDSAGKSIGIYTDGAGLQSNVNGGEIVLETATTSGTGVRGKIQLNGREIDVTSKKVTNLADGSASTDAVNKGQLDAAVMVEQLARQSADSALDLRVSALESKVDGPLFQKMKIVIDESSELSYVDLNHEAIENSLIVSIGRMMAHMDEDFTVSVVGGKTRLTWVGAFAVGGEEAIELTDVIFVTYAIPA